MLLGSFYGKQEIAFNSKAYYGAFTLIDLFAGAGGMSLGFRNAGFRPVFAVEKVPEFARTYAANLGNHIAVGDIVEVIAQRGASMKADVVIGGPPCQGFSNLTNNRPTDPRRALWSKFMDVVELSRCKVFVIENVPNLLTSIEGKLIFKRAAALGFEISPSSVGVLMASEHGVPQNRKRAFIIGSKVGAIHLPAPQQKRTTVREAFINIPPRPITTELRHSPAQGIDLHIGRNPTEVSLARYKLIPQGGNRFDLQESAPHLTPKCWLKKPDGGTDLFGRLSWDEPARCTVRCEFYKPEKGRFLHPKEHRAITHWEAARLQSFPDTFRWHGSKRQIAMQIGNAVPPALAQAVAKQIFYHLLEIA